MSLVGSFEGYIMIFKDTKLAWTTKLANVPIFLMRTKIADVNGLIVSLSDNGYLSLNYLGTEKESQAELAKQFQNQQKVDYQRLDQEHRETIERIRSFEND